MWLAAARQLIIEDLRLRLQLIIVSNLIVCTWLLNSAGDRKGQISHRNMHAFHLIFINR